MLQHDALYAHVTSFECRTCDSENRNPEHFCDTAANARVITLIVLEWQPINCDTEFVNNARSQLTNSAHDLRGKINKYLSSVGMPL